MKNMIFTILLTLLFIRCERENLCDEQGAITIPIDTYDMLNSCVFSGSETSDLNLVINSKDEFTDLISCSDDSKVTIDFEKFTLLIGKKELSWCCTELVREEVTKKCDSNDYVYNVVLNEPEGKYQGFSTFYYSVLIPKVADSENIIFNVKFQN